MRSPSWYLGVSLCLTHDFCALIINSWAHCLALLNWSSRSATCGTGDGLSVQSARGLNPYKTKKGDSPVVSFSQLLCANSANRKSTRLNSSHVAISYAVFCLKK